MTLSRDEPALRWLRSFERAVAARDFDAGEALFAEDVLAYGTLSPVMHGRRSLIDQQWKPVWTATRSFHFTELDSVTKRKDGWVLAARWASESIGGAQRQGRCTLVLDGSPPRCVHSHFSMVPSDGARL